MPIDDVLTAKSVIYSPEEHGKVGSKITTVIATMMIMDLTSFPWEYVPGCLQCPPGKRQVQLYPDWPDW